MKTYTYETDYKGKMNLVPCDILVEGVSEYYVREHHEGTFDSYTRKRKLSKKLVFFCEEGEEKALLKKIRANVLGPWRIGDLVFLCNKEVYGFIIKVNRVKLVVDNPNWKKPMQPDKTSVMLISRNEEDENETK